jgi:hypothetical protein
LFLAGLESGIEARSTPAGLQAQTRPGFQKPQDTSGSRFQPRPSFHPGFKNRPEPSLVQDVSRKEIKLLQSPMIVDTQQRLEELNPGSQMKPKPGTQLRPEWTLGLEFKPMIKSNLALGFDNRSFQIDSSNESMLHQESSHDEITSQMEEGYQLRSYWRGHGSVLGVDKKPYQVQTVNKDGKGFQSRLDQGAGTRAFQAQTRDDLPNPESKSIPKFQEGNKSHSGAEPQCKSEIRKGLGLLDKKPIQFQPRDEHYMPMRPDQDAGLKTGFSDRALLQIKTRDERMNQAAVNLQSRQYQDAGFVTGSSDRALQIQPRDEIRIGTGVKLQSRPYQESGLRTGSVSQIQTRDDKMMQTGPRQVFSTKGPEARMESRLVSKLDESRLVSKLDGSRLFSKLDGSRLVSKLDESRLVSKLDGSRSQPVQQFSQEAGFDSEGQSGDDSSERRAQFRQELEAKLSLIFAERNFPKKVEEEDSIDVPEGGWGGLKIDLEAVTEEETEV